MELRRYLRLLLRRWILIIVTVVVALGVGWAVTAHSATTYTSTSTVMVGPRSYITGSSGGGNLPTTNQAAGLSSLVLTYSHLADTAAIAAAAVQATGAPRSVAQVVAETSASTVPYTQLITIAVTDASPQVARELATAMADAFVARVGAPGAPASGGATPISLQSVGPAGPAAASVPAGHKRDLAVAGIFGLLVAIALAVLVEYLDVTVKEPEDAARRLGAPLLTTVAAFTDLGGPLAGGGTASATGPSGDGKAAAPTGAEIG